MSDRHEESWVKRLPAGVFDLQQELEKFRQLRDVVIPDDVSARMDRATVELAVSHPLDRVVRVGSPAPGFSLPGATGQDVGLEGLLGRGAVVLSFYRGVWCPFCNLELRALQQQLPQISELGAAVVAISGQTPDNSLSMVERNELGFEVLSDVGLVVARSYGLVFELPGYLQEAYREEGHPVPHFNGTAEQTLPIPATFVIDRQGIVRFAYAEPNYMYRADPADIIATLRALNSEHTTSVAPAAR